MNRNWTYLVVILILFSCVKGKTKKEYYSTGELKAEYKISDNKKHGDYKEYYRDGKLKVDAYYSEGKLDGMIKFYYDNEQVKWQVNYTNGKENGHYKKYSKNGKLIEKLYYENGVREGLARRYYLNGKLKREVDYENGINNGYYKEYYKDGQLKFHSISVNDTTKFYREFSEKGNIIDEYRYVELKPMIDTIYEGEDQYLQIKVYGPYEEENYLAVSIIDSLDQPFATYSKEEINESDTAVILNNHFEEAGQFFFCAKYIQGDSTEVISENCSKIVVLPKSKRVDSLKNKVVK